MIFIREPTIVVNFLREYETLFYKIYIRSSMLFRIFITSSFIISYFHTSNYTLEIIHLINVLMQDCRFYLKSKNPDSEISFLAKYKCKGYRTIIIKKLSTILL